MTAAARFAPLLALLGALVLPGCAVDATSDSEEDVGTAESGLNGLDQVALPSTPATPGETKQAPEPTPWHQRADLPDSPNSPDPAPGSASGSRNTGSH